LNITLATTLLASPSITTDVHSCWTGAFCFCFRIYVANLDANAISVIDGQNNTRIGKEIRVGTQPVATANNGITNRIYVANFRDNSVSVIDGQTNTKIGKDILAYSSSTYTRCQRLIEMLG
jgi:YVTN family beta-propeller protein